MQKNIKKTQKIKIQKIIIIKIKIQNPRIVELPPCNLLLPRASWSLHSPRSRIQLQHYLDSVTAPLPWLFHVGKITIKK